MLVFRAKLSIYSNTTVNYSNKGVKSILHRAAMCILQLSITVERIMHEFGSIMEINYKKC